MAPTSTGKLCMMAHPVIRFLDHEVMRTAELWNAPFHSGCYQNQNACARLKHVVTPDGVEGTGKVEQQWMTPCSTILKVESDNVHTF